MWHKITDDKPSMFETLLATDGQNVSLGYYGGTGLGFYWEHDGAKQPITHWLHLSNLLSLPGLSFDTEEDLENCVQSVIADVTLLEDAVLGISEGGDAPDNRDMIYIRLAHLVLLIAEKAYPGLHNYEIPS